MRAFWALFVAALREYWREPVGVSMGIAMPLMFIGFFGFAFAGATVLGSPAATTPSTIRQIDFVVAGVLGLEMMWLGAFAAMPLAAQRELGVLRRFGVTPTSRVTVVAANVMARLVASFVQGALLIAVGAVAFGVPVRDLGATAVVVAVGTLVFVTLGYAIAGVAPTQPAAHGVAQLATMPMVFLSGVFVPTATLPGFLQPIVLALPLTYLTDALRQTTLGPDAAAFSLATSLLVMIGWIIGLTLISIKTFRWT